jgi:hypothetical protein
VTYKVYNWANAVIYTGQSVTTDYGWANFEPTVTANTGRVKVVASATSDSGSASSTFYRQTGPEDGIFGIVTNAATGSVVFSSPTGGFAPVTVSVTNGAVYAPSLGSVRGTIQAKFTGTGVAATRIFTKAESPYGLQLTGQATGTAKMTIVSGNNQTATVGTYFGSALKVRVFNAAGKPVSGVSVKFAAPTSGARATFSGSSTYTVKTDTYGYATSVKPKAGTVKGSYSVKATASGYPTVTFELTNKT